LADKHFFSDIIINHTPGFNQNKYKKETYTKIYSGIDYALLREAFYNAQFRAKPPRLLKKCIICFGGSDPENYTLKYLNLIKNKLKNLNKISIIIGPSYIHERSLFLETDEKIKIEIHKNVNANELIKLINKSDFAVVSASSISIECTKIGIPLYLIKTADNQNNNYRFMLMNRCADSFTNLNEYNYQRGKKMLESQKLLFKSDIKNNLKNIFIKLT